MRKLIGERLKGNPKLCPECGENVKGANFCPNCGTSLEIYDEKTRDETDIQAAILRDDSKMASLDLTPAESLMILDHKKYSQKKLLLELLQVTMIDLVFKKVFKLDTQEVEFNGRIIKKISLEEGNNFNMPLKPHEEVFREKLPSNEDNRLRILQTLVLRDTFKYDYAKEKLLKPLLSDGFFTIKKSLFGKKFSLSDAGEETKQIIKQLINDGKNLDNWLDRDPEKAKAYMLIGGSNVFLTDKNNLRWFKNNSGRVGRLFSSGRVRSPESDYFNYYWYPTFIFGSQFMDMDDLGNVFNDFNMTNLFDSIDSHAFDFGFNVTGSDFGGSDSGIDNGTDNSGFDSGGYDSGGFDSGGDSGGGGD